MGRIRTIKPEILTDAKTVGLSDTAWRFFVSLFVLADDSGRLPAEDLVLAGQIFPGRASRITHGALTECSDMGLVRAYSVRGQKFVEICGWSKHQKINRPSGPKFPAPCESFSEDSVSAHGGLSEDSVSAHGGLSEDSLPYHDLYHDHDHDHSPPQAAESFDFEAVYQQYPRKQGKAAGMKKARAKIRSAEDFDQLRSSVEHMAKAWAGQDLAFCPYWSSFISQELWRDETPPLPGAPQGRRQDTAPPMPILEPL